MRTKNVTAIMNRLSNLLVLFVIVFIAIACREDKEPRVTKLQLNADKTTILCDGSPRTDEIKGNSRKSQANV